MRLKNWSVTGGFSQNFTAPELRKYYLQGNVYGHPDFKDGDPVITSRIIKINDIKTLIINNGISILCSFVAILMIWNNYNFDVNITIIWLIYPLYLCGDYFIKIHGKYLIYEEKVNTEIEKNDIIDEAVC